MKKWSISSIISGVFVSGFCGGVSNFLDLPDKVAAVLGFALSSNVSISVSVILASIIGFAFVNYGCEPQKIKEKLLAIWSLRNRKFVIKAKYVIAIFFTVLMLFVILIRYGVYKISEITKQNLEAVEIAKTQTEDRITEEYRSKIRRLTDQIADMQSDNKELGEKIEKLITTSPESKELWEKLNMPSMIDLGSGNIHLNLKNATMNGCGQMITKDEGDATIIGEDWKQNCPTEK